MPTTKAIKKRIASVNNTKKIMKAMDLVAASKLQKAKSRLEDIRPLYVNMKQVMDGLKAGIGDGAEVPFAGEREIRNIAYIVLTSDRGLCGGYNVNVAKEALSCIKSHADIQEKLITIGTKGWEYFRRRNKNIVYKANGATETATFENAELIGSMIATMYESGEADEVYLVYTHFETVLSHIPKVEKLLPVSIGPGSENANAAGGNGPDDGDTAASPGTGNPGTAIENNSNDTKTTRDMSYDPDIHTFISYAVPMYLNVAIYGAMIESAVCEYASRMTSMDAATRNAGEIIDDLTLDYNRKRQSMITQEITEIVSGANALK